ncbi:MAG TPA: FCD domain-containing protein, partial [Thermohalobaculum sp.]|nr:FCD domain-containing protein [Thermohalobaculum sp.]
MTGPAVPRPRRHDSISEKIKEMIVAEAWKPGERLPPERELMQMFGASKSSVREAISALAAQGLVRSRTGPGGGLFLTGIAPGRAMELLSNLFVFAPPSIAEIYAVRRELEPEMAAAVAETIDAAGFARLEAVMRLYDAPPKDSAEEYAQRLAELDFHSVLAELCPNRVLGFFCGFLQTMLREMAVCRRIYDAPNPALRDTALHYQLNLLRALRARDGAAARAIMREHMLAAQAYMERVEAEVRPRFLRVRRE